MRPRIVGVIFSRTDLRRALRMRKPPDLFELRLDALIASLREVTGAIGELRAPLIITARHPGEGGANQLSAARRRALLLQFLPHSQYLDVELRSARSLSPVLRRARSLGIRRIISFHDFEGAPFPGCLEQMLAAARSLGADIFKVAMRTDTAADLRAVLDFFDRQRGAPVVVAMGIGKFARHSRLALARRGCALNYARLHSTAVSGQLSISELRRALR